MWCHVVWYKFTDVLAETAASILEVEFTQKMVEADFIARSVYFNMDSFIVKTEPVGSKQILVNLHQTI